MEDFACVGEWHVYKCSGASSDSNGHPSHTPHTHRRRRRRSTYFRLFSLFVLFWLFVSLWLSFPVHCHSLTSQAVSIMRKYYERLMKLAFVAGRQQHRQHCATQYSVNNKLCLNKWPPKNTCEKFHFPRGLTWIQETIMLDVLRPLQTDLYNMRNGVQRALCTFCPSVPSDDVYFARLWPQKSHICSTPAKQYTFRVCFPQPHKKPPVLLRRKIALELVEYSIR